MSLFKMKGENGAFLRVREIIGAHGDVAHQVTAPTASTLFESKEIATWMSALQGADLRIPWSAEELHLYGSQMTLESGQIGYRVDASGKVLPDWKDEWLVLGQISGDPIIGEFDKSTCTILFARHGAGSWQANPVSADIATFAVVLQIWCDLFITKYSKNVYDDTFAIRSDFLVELRQRVSQWLSSAQTDVFMSMVDG
ncbi:hypothetical protein [Burkholderia dolosa]|uniref:hypothetical protein n=1 Tax=Burkholderia dolosa TaxID=152500 RepID=UPI001B92A742|nr:hypothetical protein [Burkholderia dolosa]MBR8060214.1 hypothetical protein [Burkholderia dolosa]MBR8304420.1 hypothetical protein [Burkholderia dolosa]